MQVSPSGSLLSRYLSKPNTDDIINALKPGVGYFYIKSDSEEFNPLKRTYSRSVSWVIPNEGVSIPGIGSGINNLP